MTFAEIVGNLRSYDEDPGAWEELSIYVADPQAPQSEAIVEWSLSKGGLPEAAGHNGRVLLYYLTPVRKALTLLGSDYDRLVSEEQVQELCALLVKRVEDDQAALRERVRR